jgi:hypothetical protein
MNGPTDPHRGLGGFAKSHPLAIVILGLLGLTVIVGLVGDTHPHTSGETKYRVTARSESSGVPGKPPSGRKVRELEAEEDIVGFKQSIRGAVPHDTAPEVSCFGQTNCGVTYKIEGEAGLPNFEYTLVEEQAPVWEAMFSNPKFQGGFIQLEAAVQSAGGKELGIQPILRVRCDRAADREIDWQNIELEGLKQLCRWTELIKF